MNDTPVNARADRLLAELERLLDARDRASAIAAALDAVAGGLSVPDLYVAVLGPLLVREGERWKSGEIAVWEEHFQTATVRTIVESLYPQVARAAADVPRADRRAVLACPPQEQHDLAMRMLADRLELAGWDAFFLGADTPADEIVAAARAVSADTVILSASTHFQRIALRTLVSHIEASLPGVAVCVGGTAFERERESWTACELLDVDALLAGGVCEPGHAADHEGTA